MNVKNISVSKLRTLILIGIFLLAYVPYTASASLPYNIGLVTLRDPTNNNLLSSSEHIEKGEGPRVSFEIEILEDDTTVFAMVNVRGIDYTSYYHWIKQVNMGTFDEGRYPLEMDIDWFFEEYWNSKPYAFGQGSYKISTLAITTSTGTGSDYTSRLIYNPNFRVDVVNPDTDNTVFRLGFADNSIGYTSRTAQEIFDTSSGRFSQGGTDGDDNKYASGINIKTYVFNDHWTDANLDDGEYHIYLTNDLVVGKLRQTYYDIYGRIWIDGHYTYTYNSGFDLLYGLSSAQNHDGNIGQAPYGNNIAFSLGDGAALRINNAYYDELVQHETSHCFGLDESYFWNTVMWNIWWKGFYSGYDSWRNAEANTLMDNSDYYSNADPVYKSYN